MKKIKSLAIHGKRWFQKTYGNNYHSVLVVVNDEKLVCQYTYGYGEAYLDTAYNLMRENGYDVPDKHSLRQKIDYITCDDVSRKRDLSFNV